MVTGTRGQSSIELMAYVGLFTLALSAATAYVWPEIQTRERVSTAEATVSDIRQTIDNVYASGPGRKETISVRIPTGVTRTQASGNRILIQLSTQGKDTSDVLEVTNAPIKGHIPSVDGTHQMTIEYTNNGFILVGSGLGIEPAYTELSTTANNRTNFTISVINSADRSIGPIVMEARGQSAWFTFNETGFTLNPTGFKTLQVEVATNDTLPALYTNYVIADAPDDYAEATVNVDVGGIACGDMVLEAQEECETRTPFTFPDRNNPNCPNPISGGGGGVTCDTANFRFKAYDQYGDCIDGCTCKQDTPTWAVCGDGCSDPNYCNNCLHCLDNKTNCGETVTDGGGSCPICDEVDDRMEGFQCSLGEIMACSENTTCQGTKTCVRAGTAGCGWSHCSTFGVHCQGPICCTCGGTDATNPVTVFNITFSADDCKENVISCGNPNTCQGGIYSQTCAGIGACAINASNLIIANNMACLGVTCKTLNDTCTDTIYPCHGVSVAYACNATAKCQGTNTSNDGVCFSVNTCGPPQTGILNKLDVDTYNDYVDYPASRYVGWTSAYDPTGSGTLTNPTRDTYTTMYYTEAGAYYPYRNGKMYIYSKDGRVNNHCLSQSGVGLSACTDSCPWLGTPYNVMRVGNNASNYWEYPGLAPGYNNNGWRRITINLAAPTRTVGSPNWNGTIGLLEFQHVSWTMSIDYFHCYIYKDYATVSP